MTNTTEQSNLHGHTILKKLTQTPMTIAELKAWLTSEFGEHFQFHTCSQEGLTFDEIVGFFQDRGKIVELEGKWQTQINKVCSH